MRKLLNSLLGILTLALLSLSSCQPDSIEPDGVSGRIITHDTVWAPGAPILLRGQTVVRGGTLTIEAGTIVEFAENAQLIIGDQGAADLAVKGTAESPVVFRPHADAEKWCGVAILSAGKRSSISHLTVKNAGDSINAAVKIVKLGFPVDGLKILRAQGIGLQIASASQEAQYRMPSLYVESTRDHAIRIGASALALLPEDLDVRAGKNKGIHVESGTLNAPFPISLPDHYVPYIFSRVVALNAPRLTLGPGASFLFDNKNAGLDIGGIAATEFYATNCQFHPTNAQSWRGISLNANTSPKSQVVSCKFQAGGHATNAALSIYDVHGITVKFCEFNNCPGYGIALYSASIEGLSNHFNYCKGDILNTRKP